MLPGELTLEQIMQEDEYVLKAFENSDYSSNVS